MADPSVIQNITNTSATAATTVPFAAATANNHLVLAVAADDYKTADPAGWTLPAGGGQATYLGAYLWYRKATGGETSVQYTIGSASPSTWILLELSNLTGLDVSDGTLRQSSGASLATPAIVPTAGRRYVLAAVGASSGALGITGMGSWTDGFTELQDNRTAPASGTQDELAVAALAMDADGATPVSTTATTTGSTPEAMTAVIAAFVVAGGTSFTRPLTDTASGVDAGAGRTLTSPTAWSTDYRVTVG